MNVLGRLFAGGFAKKKRLLSVFLAAAVLAAALPLSVFASKETEEKIKKAKEEKEQTENAIEDNQQNIDSMNSTKNSLQGELNNLNGQLSEISDNLSRIEDNIKDKQQEIDDTTADLEEAEKATGIDFEPPVENSLPEGYDLVTYRYMEDLLEAVYQKGNEEIAIRISKERSGIELSGDYNNYSKEWEENYKGLVVTCRGDGTLINCANADLENIHFVVEFQLAS